jgi:hypothetical protein
VQYKASAFEQIIPQPKRHANVSLLLSIALYFHLAESEISNIAMGWLVVVSLPVAAIKNSQFHISFDDANRLCVHFALFSLFCDHLVRASKAITNKRAKYKNSWQ